MKPLGEEELGVCVVIGVILFLGTNPVDVIPSNECAGATLGVGKG